jgi:hypothetical protein
MLEIWTLNRLLTFVALFFATLKLVSKTLRVNVLVEFLGGNDERFKGVVWIGLNGIPTQVEHA